MILSRKYIQEVSFRLRNSLVQTNFGKFAKMSHSHVR